MMQSLVTSSFFPLERLHTIYLCQKEKQVQVLLRGNRAAALADDLSLDDEVMRFLQVPKKILLLLGNAGSGKTVYCKQLARRLPNSIYSAW